MVLFLKVGLLVARTNSQPDVARSRGASLYGVGPQKTPDGQVDSARAFILKRITGGPYIGGGLLGTVLLVFLIVYLMRRA
jgi:hypothetical protein